MIRTNLSTRPFYNERAVRSWMGVLALIVAAATAFNVSRVFKYSHADTQLAGEASRDEARAADLRQQAAKLRASIDAHAFDIASTDAHNANELIDRRTFSWTDLFNRFETTLPDDVRIVSVRPRLDPKGPIVIQIIVGARNLDDVHGFMENLNATGAFPTIRPVEDHVELDGSIAATIESTYVPSVGKPARSGGATEP